MPEPKPNDSPASSKPDAFQPFNPRIHPKAAEALEAVKNWTRAAIGGSGYGLVLWANVNGHKVKDKDGKDVAAGSGYGNGKTLLAKCAANALYATLVDKNGLPDRSGIFTTTEKFLDGVKNSYDNGGAAQWYRYYRSARFLILDDFGTEYAKELGWLQEQFYKLLNYAYDAKQPFMLTSNLTPADMLDRLGGKNWSRLRGMTGEQGFINLSAVPDQRRAK